LFHSGTELDEVEKGYDNYKYYKKKKKVSDEFIIILLLQGLPRRFL